MTDMERKLKQLELEAKEEDDKKKKKTKAAGVAATPKKSNPLLEFFVGAVLLGAGIYWILNSFVVSFSWGSLWSSFGMSTQLATGLMLIPLLIGIGLAFFLKHKWIAGVVIAIGLVIILVTLLTSVRFRPLSASLWQYILMFGMTAAGAGLLAKCLLTRRDD